MSAGEYHVELIEDRPSSGMWHCGPNAAWVAVTHLPTMISARAFDQSHHHARQAAQACCEMMVEQSRLLKCQFPERVARRVARRRDAGPNEVNGSGVPAAVTDRSFHSKLNSPEAQHDGI